MTKLKFRLLILLSAAWRRRYVIFVPILIMPFIGLSVSKMAPTQYRSHTSMLLQETAKMNPFLEDIAVSTMLNERLSAVKTLLKSRHVLHSVAAELKLINDDMSPAEVERVIQKISNSLSVSQLGKDFLKINHTSNSPDGMKAMLESVSRHFIEQLLAPERSSITDSSEFLTIHIKKRATELEQAEQALAQYTNLNSALTPDMQNQSLSRLATLKQSLAEKQAELAGVEKSMGSLDEQLSKTNPVVGRIEEQIIDIRSELTLLRAKYTDNHSAVQAKKRELNRLEQERTIMLQQKQPGLNSDQLWDIASSTNTDELRSVQPLLISQLHNLQVARGNYESLKEETKSLKGMINELEMKATNFGDNTKQLYRLTRDVEIKRTLYEELMSRYEMAQLTGSLGIFEQNDRVKIIDLPYTPSTPTNFPTIVFVIAGLFAGLFLGVGLAVLMEIFDTSIRLRQELEQLTGVPVLTVIPRIR